MLPKVARAPRQELRLRGVEPASNLDEFEMVRYAGLREQVRAGVTKPSQEGLTPAVQVEQIEELSLKLIAEQLSRWRQLKEELESENIHVLSAGDLSKKDLADLDTFFRSHILSPENISLTSQQG